ncbi:MAG: DUF2890 domain-containing protein [Deltaproteobacteria bacterium]|nr:MAG: DUF2890 domain-containing protein [Deltaproteobacteria bacterium]
MRNANPAMQSKYPPALPAVRPARRWNRASSRAASLQHHRNIARTESGVV